ncbi:hypothetical protein PENSPDRAFT_657605 [Peniophora sp. CONT]|nr:hypothetical protein PENSPDRAFT_657605 [Peniophora sp. CONT]
MSSTNASRSAVDDDNIWTTCVESRFPTMFHNAGSPADSLERTATMDQEIAKIEACLILAKKKRNVNAACSRLPPDCLKRVFTFVRDIWPPSREKSAADERWKYHLGWLRVTHICSKWRECALSTPTLWSELACSAFKPSSMTELLRRSKLAPLHLHIDVDPSDSADICQWLSGPQTLRVESLTIDGANPNESEALKLLQPLLVYEFPSLKTLRLAQHSTEKNFALPQNILSYGRRPTLTSIICTSWMPTWPISFSMRHVQCLHLCMSMDVLPTTLSGAYLLPTAQQLTDMLSAMHSPRDIHLEDTFPFEGSFSIPIKLPDSLERLRLCATRDVTSRMCTQLWSWLIIPPNASVFIDIRSTENDEIETVHKTLANPNSSFQMHAAEIVFGLAATLLMGSGTHLQPCPADPETIINTGLESPGSDCYSPGPSSLLGLDPDDLRYSTMDLASHLQLGSVRVLHFTLRVLQERPDSQLWVDTLTRAHRVERVVLSVAPASTTLLYAMAQTLHSHSPETKLFALFSCLHTLTLHGYRTKVADVPAFVDVLIYLIHVRREFGHPLRMLHVSASLKESLAWDSVASKVPITWFE